MSTASSASLTASDSASARLCAWTVRSTQLLGRANNADRDLAAIGDQEFTDRPSKGPLSSDLDQLSISTSGWPAITASSFSTRNLHHLAGRCRP